MNNDSEIAALGWNLQCCRAELHFPCRGRNSVLCMLKMRSALNKVSFDLDRIIRIRKQFEDDDSFSRSCLQYAHSYNCPVFSPSSSDAD
jgi:hypothetical protein